MKSRQIAPDFVKGVAILLMVYGHVIFFGDYAQTLETISKWLSTLRMPLFLIISGFYFRLSNDAMESCHKQLSRVVRPYLIFFTLYLILLTIVNYLNIPTTNEPPKSLWEGLLMVLAFPNGAYWFLHSLILLRFSLLIPRLRQRPLNC